MMKNSLDNIHRYLISALALLLAVVTLPLKAVKAASAQYNQANASRTVHFLKWQVRGGILVAAVIGLGVLVIVIPLVYGIAATVGSNLSFPGLTAAQSSTLATLVANGGSALSLTTIAETVVGAGIIILAIALYFRLR